MSEIRAPHFRHITKLRDGEKWTQEFFKERPIVVALSAAVTDLANDLRFRESYQNLKPLAPLPAERCWIELKDYSGPQIDVERVGRLRAFIVFPFGEGAERTTLFGAVHDKEVALSIWETYEFTGDNRQFGALFVAICAVLAAPGVRSVDEQRREKRLRKSGQAAPMVTYRCVDIDLDKLAGIPEVAGHDASGRVGFIALHHVRGHLRLTEKGLRPVRPHWRGSAKNGIRFKDHNVMRNEEMH